MECVIDEDPLKLCSKVDLRLKEYEKQNKKVFVQQVIFDGKRHICFIVELKR